MSVHFSRECWGTKVRDARTTKKVKEEFWCQSKINTIESTYVTNDICWGKWGLICKLIEILKVPVLRRVISINIGRSRDKDEIQAGNLGTPR